MIDQTINGYTIKRLIGSGGMAEVYYAENSLGLPAAVKVLKREYSLNSQITERFMNEAKIMKSLHHPHIRKVMDMGRLEEQPCILMEYLEGGTLKGVMSSHKKVDDSSLQKYFDQCAQALIYTHSKGITHRDIKPSNIFITKEGVVKLVDFGIAKSELSISHTITGQTLGTVIYMSPEQVVDPKRVTGKTDIYSLGVTFYHALLGKSPYDATTGSEFTVMRKIVDEDLDLKLIPSHWKPVLSGCLQKKPEDRKELKAKNFDEETIVEDGQLPTPGPSTPMPPSTSASHNWLYFLIGGLVLAVGLIFGMRSCGEGSDFDPELIVYEENGLYGYKDGKGEIVITARYELANPFFDDRARVSVLDSVYYIDNKGTIMEMIRPREEEVGEGEDKEELKASERQSEDNAWSKAERTDTKASYNRYLRDYPTGRYASEARSKISEIESSERKAEDERKAEAERRRQAAAQTPAQKAAQEIAATMVRISGGTFTMGCTSEQSGDCDSHEKPAHQVTLSGFSINKYQVTQGQWEAIMENNPSRFRGCDRCPVERVSWNEVQEFIKKLNNLTGRNYRLPTEAEWEYAARGGQNFKYSGSNNIGSVAWYSENSGSKTHPVGHKAVNGYGLYDMSGNVWEWCSDWDGSYSSGAKTNPRGPTTGSNRVRRGGSWISLALFCRDSFRGRSSQGSRSSDIGFRLAE